MPRRSLHSSSASKYRARRNPRPDDRAPAASPRVPIVAAVWVILPTYNEAANIEALVTAVLEALPPSRRVLIVDDSSPDGTGEIATRLAGEDDDVEVLHRPHKAGPRPRLHRRVQPRPGGWGRAGCGDGRRLLPRRLPTCRACSRQPGDADLVIGSRYVPGGGVRTGERCAGRSAAAAASTRGASSGSRCVT